MFDLLIRGGTCYDGRGGEPFRADVAIRDGLILAIGTSLDGEAARAIDASGLAVAPGFIDTHSHSDLVALVEPEIVSKTTQGVTTEIIGQDGMSPAPVTTEHLEPWKKTMAGLEGQYPVDWGWRSAEEYLAWLDSMALGPNIAWLAPTGNIRMCVMGLEDRPATEGEIMAMCELLEACLDQGAVGLSTGLIYPPSSYMSEEELARLTTVAGRRGLPFVIHQRSEADDILRSMDEASRICERSGCPLHFSHFKLCGKKNARLFDDVMRKLDEVGQRVSRLSFDQYPYAAGSTTFSVILPPWAHDGGADACLARLADPEARARMKRDIAAGIPGWDNFVDFAGMEDIFVTFVKTEKNADLVGKNMIEIGRMRGKDPLDASFDMLLEEDLAVGLVDFYGLEEHVEAIMRHPLQDPCTDGILGARPHPRVYGSFTRILGRYVRERKIMSLPEAIHKMTERPAGIFKLGRRGVLEQGYAADITIFDPDTVRDRATYEEPMQWSVGVPYVIVGGRVVVDGHAPVKVEAGKVLRAEKERASE
ncbi:MAG: D-aminoacylase [Synergistaceae bacterium]|nr:D-aminoacylase [Synergistaceae bacterium]